MDGMIDKPAVLAPAPGDAARLECFAPAGGTAVTAAVRATLPPEVAALFEAAGTVAMKGVGDTRVAVMPRARLRAVEQDVLVAHKGMLS